MFGAKEVKGARALQNEPGSAARRHLPGARKNGGYPPAVTVGLFFAFKCEIRMPPPRFEMAHPISQDYAVQIIEKAHLPGAS
jgi:hypothetical protein